MKDKIESRVDIPARKRVYTNGQWKDDRTLTDRVAELEERNAVLENENLSLNHQLSHLANEAGECQAVLEALANATGEDLINWVRSRLRGEDHE